jgi:hypothetical protein
MPLPNQNPSEDNKDFVARCMKNEKMQKEFPDSTQRVAICMNQSKSLLQQVCDNIETSDGFTEELCALNMVIPDEEDYVDFNEATEDIELQVAVYRYKDPVTQEIFLFNYPGVHKKNDRKLVLVSEASEYQGRKVTLNKPFRTPDGPKKFSVYVKNDKGNVVKVNFGDPNMKIKKNIPGRRKSFRARHNCDNPGPKWKARYWSCKAW